MRARVGCVLLALALAACSGGASAIPHPPSGGGNPAKKATVKIKVVVPGARASKLAHHRLSPRLKRAWDVAANTKGIQILAYAHGDRTTVIGTTLVDISAGSANCGATNPYGGRTCALALQATTGNDDFVATTYDQAPSGGVIPSGANELGYGVATQNVVAGTTASFNLALSGVLASVRLSLVPNALHLMVPTTGTLDVYGLDADGDVIVGNGYIDGNGNPITLALAADNTLPVVNPGASPKPSLSLATASLTAPPPAGVRVTYAPTVSGYVPAAATVTISATSSATTVPKATTTLAAVAPAFSSMAAANTNSNNPYHGGMAFDNGAYSVDNVYFSAPNGNGSIDECANCATTSAVRSVAGTALQPYRGGIAGDQLGLGGLGESLHIYAVGGTQAQLITNGPVATRLTPSSTGAPIPNGSAMLYDNARTAIVYTSGANLIFYQTSGTVFASTYLAATTSAGIALDNSDNPWVVDAGTNRILECLNCTGAASFVIGTAANGAMQSGGNPFDVFAVGSKMFVTDRQTTNPAVLELSSSGSAISRVNTIALPSGVRPWYLAGDNGQPGIVWFDYLDANTLSSSGGSTIGIGRMDTTVNPPTFLIATAPTASLANCINAPNGTAGAIGAGPSGTIYAVFDGAFCLVRMQR